MSNNMEYIFEWVPMWPLMKEDWTQRLRGEYVEIRDIPRGKWRRGVSKIELTFA